MEHAEKESGVEGFLSFARTENKTSGWVLENLDMEDVGG